MFNFSKEIKTNSNKISFKKLSFDNKAKIHGGYAGSLTAIATGIFAVINAVSTSANILKDSFSSTNKSTNNNFFYRKMEKNSFLFYKSAENKNVNVILS